MFISLGTLAYVFGAAPLANGQPALSDTAGTIALIAANAFVVFFGISWGPTVWVLLGEMFNNRIRAAALGLAAAAQWISNFLISTTFPALFRPTTSIYRTGFSPPGVNTLCSVSTSNPRALTFSETSFTFALCAGPPSFP